MYILKINKSFVKIKDKQITIIPNYEHASKYNTIGDGMRAAVIVNKLLGSHLAKVIEL